METLTKDQYNQLRAEGYNNIEINKALTEINKQETLVASGNIPYTPSQTSRFAMNPNDNVVKWQVDMEEILERFEHFLRGDELIEKDGNKIWVKSEDKKDRIVNEYGVNEIMNFISMYLNKNTILSDYSDDEINEIMFNFGKSFSDYLFRVYEKIELGPHHYDMLVREVVDAIRSAYKRAKTGGERRSLREARSITQSETLIPQTPNNLVRERSLLNPVRYVAGKYH
jgi:hypothetical protein